MYQFDFSKEIYILPRQSSLINGGGQIHVPVVSLQRPPLKHAFPSESHMTAEQSSPAKPDGHVHVGGISLLVFNEQIPLFKQTNPLLPHISN